MGRQAKARRAALISIALAAAVAAALLTGVSPSAAHSLQGTLDPSFGRDGRVFSQLGDSFGGGEFTSMARLPDGKLVMLEATEDGEYGLIERRDASGALDASFGSGGSTVVARPEGLALQPDGAVLYMTYQPGGSCGSQTLRRLRPDGSRDLSFGTNGCAHVPPLYVRHLAVQPDGGIVVAGASPFCPCGHVNPPTQLSLGRLLPNGDLDKSFSGDGVIEVRGEGRANDTGATGLALRDDGTILVTGTSSLLALTPDGHLVESFGNGGKIDLADSPGALLGLPDGGAVVAKYHCCAESPGLVLERYRADGSVDSTFGGDGRLSISPVREVAGMALAPDGGVVVVGRVRGPENCRGSECRPAVIIRVDSAGSRDWTFGDNGFVLFPRVPFQDSGSSSLNAVAISPSGQILAAGGERYRGDAFITARQPNGQPDGSFGRGGVVNDVRVVPSSSEAAGLALEPDGGIVVSARSDVGLHAERPILVAWRPSGLPDPDLDPGTSSAAVESVGEIRPAGRRHVYAVERYGVVRLALDGQPDDSWGLDGRAGLPPGFKVGSLRTGANGKLLILGRIDGRPGMAVFQLNARGHPDRSFGQRGLALVRFGRKLEGETLAAAVDRRGRTILVGGFRGFNLTAIARLLPSGRLDHGFGRQGRLALGLPHSSAASVALQPGGGILVAVGPDEPGPGRMSLIRLHRDGSRDRSFGRAGVLHGRPPAQLISLFAYRGQIVLVSTRGAFGEDGVELRAYEPDGRPDRRFGRNGVLVATASQERQFRASAAARQGNGCIVVAGTAGRIEEIGSDIELLRFC